MKCQKCNQTSQVLSATCPHCNENYTLADILQWVINEKGDTVLNDVRSLKSFISDLCRDNKYDVIVFEGLLNQGFSKKVYELSKSNDFEDGLDTYCNSLSNTFNIVKITYIADAFYYAIMGKNRVHKAEQLPPTNTTKTIQNNIYTPPTSNTPILNPNIVTKVKTFDFKKFFSNLNVQNIKTFIHKNKTASIGVAGVVAFIIFISIILSVAGSMGERKPENNSSLNSTYEDNYNDENKNETVNTSSYNYLTEDTISDTVYQGTAKEYYIKANNPGVYRFTATDRTANYNVYIKVYGLNDDRVLDITNEGSCTLEANGTYKITVETDSSSCSYKLNINRPNEIKTLSKETSLIHDAITYIDQCNVYTFSAPVSGRYRIDCLNRTDGYNLDIEIYNSNNDRVFRETNGGYLDMEKGVVYSIRVAYSTGACEYDVRISIPNAIREITAEEKNIPDKFTFANQINTYTYTAPLSGKYRFETVDRTNGYNVQLRIYDANNNRIVMESNNGTVDMEKDVKYRIEIEYDTELCSYNLVIGVPNEVKEISLVKAVADSITYVNQENRYTFTPSSSGEYIVKASNRTNDYNVEIYMYDANNNRVLCENNEGRVTLTSGTLYTIYVRYVDNRCDYNLTISK